MIPDRRPRSAITTRIRNDSPVRIAPAERHNDVMPSARSVRSSLVLGASVVIATALAGCAADSGTPDVSPSSSVPAATQPDPRPTSRPTRVAKELVGLIESDAVLRAQQAGLTTRVVERDGEQFPVTMDYSSTRVNLVITDGTVTTATIG